MRLWLGILLMPGLLFFGRAHGLEKLGVKFEDTITLGDKKLELNGVCLRKVRRLGIWFKVYLGGLYLEKKTSVEDKILELDSPKVLRLVFLRSVSKGTLSGAWTEAFKKNCVGDCDKGKEGLKEFNNLMTDVREHSEIQINVTADAVEVSTSGQKGRITNPALASNFLRMFIGRDPPTEDCKAQFLGTKEISSQ